MIEGDLPPHKRPVIVGHQVVGTVERLDRAAAFSRPANASVSRGCEKRVVSANSAAAGRENLCEQSALYRLRR